MSPSIMFVVNSNTLQHCTLIFKLTKLYPCTLVSYSQQFVQTVAPSIGGACYLLLNARNYWKNIPTRKNPTQNIRKRNLNLLIVLQIHLTVVSLCEPNLSPCNLEFFNDFVFTRNRHSLIVLSCKIQRQDIITSIVITCINQIRKPECFQSRKRRTCSSVENVVQLTPLLQQIQFILLQYIQGDMKEYFKNILC